MRAGYLAKRLGACLARARPWAQSLGSQNKKNGWFLKYIIQLKKNHKKYQVHLKETNET